MSSVSGFILGAVVAAGLTIFYGSKLNDSLEAASARYLPEAHLPDGKSPDRLSLTETRAIDTPPQAAGGRALELQDPAGAEDPTRTSMEELWAEFASSSHDLQPAGDFPWRHCFSRAAAAHELPESLLLAVARGESNFDPVARSDKDAVGLMQIRWPDTSRHLGITREADLYDPCTNVDAGARYLRELADQFDDDLHLVVAAYNYGPGAIAPGSVPEGARWYSRYIYRHLQEVLGSEHRPPGDSIPEHGSDGTGRELVMRFNTEQRGRDFIAFLQGEIPGLNLQLRSQALGKHDVLLLFGSDSERRSALDSIRAAGVAPMPPSSNRGIYL